LALREVERVDPAQLGEAGEVAVGASSHRSTKAHACDGGSGRSVARGLVAMRTNVLASVGD
jgi:hypothetical protein